MRLKSELWVKAYIRRCQIAGADALLVRRGDADAGAIYIKVSRLDGTALLFGPAPAGLDEAREDRRWQPCLRQQPAAEAEADAYLERQTELRFRHLDCGRGGPRRPAFPRRLAGRVGFRFQVSMVGRIFCPEPDPDTCS